MKSSISKFRESSENAAVSDSTNPSYIHALSVNHAVTAAVLRKRLYRQCQRSASDLAEGEILPRNVSGWH